MLLWDMVLPYEHELGNDAALLPRWHAAGFSFVSVHPAGDRHTLGEAMHRIARCQREIAGDPRLALARTTRDVCAARSTGRLAVGLHLEGTRPLERDPGTVALFHDVGIRFCHPVVNQSNDFGGGCHEPRDGGVTRFGRRVVKEMNRVGILLDAVHAGARTSRELMELSSAPVVISHTGCATLHPHFRNVTDNQIGACAATGGVVGIGGMGNYLGGEPTNELLLRHIEHAADLVGPRHVGLGLDYVEDVEALARFAAARPDETALRASRSAMHRPSRSPRSAS